MNDIYCDQIIPGLLEVEIIIETGSLLAFHHTSPYWERHIVLVPKKHIESLSQLSNEDDASKVEIMDALVLISRSMEDEWGGCKVCTNIGNQQTSKHLHWYVHAGKRLKNEDGTLIEEVPNSG